MVSVGRSLSQNWMRGLRSARESPAVNAGTRASAAHSPVWWKLHFSEKLRLAQMCVPLRQVSAAPLYGNGKSFHPHLLQSAMITPLRDFPWCTPPSIPPPRPLEPCYRYLLAICSGCLGNELGAVGVCLP